MCKLFMHEAYNSKFDSYKRRRLHYDIVSVVSNLSPIIYTMGCFKITLLSSVLLFLTVVSAQEYFYDRSDMEPIARARRDVGDFIMQRNNEGLRFRRDDELSRHRRQGGHGHGNGNGGGGGGGHEGITGPVHTFVKTDEHAHFKWGVRHHVGHEYAGHH